MPGLVHTQSVIDISVLAPFSTNFPETADPISQGGLWINGGTVGVNWNNVKTNGSGAYGSAFVSSVDDCLARLATSYNYNQYIEGVVSRAVGYSPSNSHEIELLCDFNISSGVAKGVECNFGHAGNGQMVKWNGPFNNFDTPVEINGMSAPVDGDVFRVEVTGNATSCTVVVKKNTVQVGSTTFSGIVAGQPGIGFFPRTGATLTSFGWKSITVGNL